MSNSTYDYQQPTLSPPNPKGLAHPTPPIAHYRLTSFPEGYHLAGTAPTSAQQLTAEPQRLATGIIIKADNDNSGQIYLRFDSAASTVTADAGASTSGWRLNAGEALQVDIDSPHKVWLIASGASQDYVACGVKA
jgi:hypothetical protein